MMLLFCGGYIVRMRFYTVTAFYVKFLILCLNIQIKNAETNSMGSCNRYKNYIVVFFLGIFSFSLFAFDEAVYKQFIPKIKTVQEPQVIGQYIIFTQPEYIRHAGIAFEFEQYKTVHHFVRVPVSRESTGAGILFYILEIPENIGEIKYRVELDGLWTNDPTHYKTVYDHVLGLSISQIDVPIHRYYKTQVLENGLVQFYFKGAVGETVRLAGSFNNWDPFMYELTEVFPGEYFLVLPVPKGEWLYAFFIGSTRYVDPTNHLTRFSTDGKSASVLVVQN